MIVGGLSQGVRNPANARAANAALNEATRLELKGRGMKGQAASYNLSCTGWGGLCFRVRFFVGILGVGWSFRGTKAAVGSGG